MFRSNDLKTGESLSKVRHVGSVRMERGIMSLRSLSSAGWFEVSMLALIGLKRAQTMAAYNSNKIILKPSTLK